MPNGRIKYRCGMEIDPSTKLLKELIPGAKEYIFCDKAYLDLNYMLCHQNLHTGERPYGC